MRLIPLVSITIALAALSACGGKKSDEPTAAANSIAAVAAPAGKVWSDEVVATDKGVRMGNPDAPLKLIEYGSYTCPHCRDFNAEAHDALIKDYVDTGKLSFEYRNFVRDPIDISAALLAHCGGTEAFFPLSNQIFLNQDAMVKQIQSASPPQYQAALSAAPNQRFINIAQLAGLVDFAKSRGIPEDKAKACLADPKAASDLAALAQNAEQEHPDFQGTPTFILNGKLLENTASWPALQPKLAAAGA